MVKIGNGYPDEPYALLIMDTFKGQDNDRLRERCSENYCEVAIVPPLMKNLNLRSTMLIYVAWQTID